LTLAQAVGLIHREEGHGIHHALFVDGVVRTMEPKIPPEYWSSALTPVCQGAIIPLERWPPGLLAEEPPLSGDFGPEIDVNSLISVQINATPSEKIDANSTVLWCATMQMAWDQLREFLGLSDFRVRDNATCAVSL